MQTILRVLNYVKKYWFAEAIAYLCMLGIAGGRLISPKIIERIVDLGIEQGQADILLNLVLLLIGVTLVTGFFRYGEGYLTESVSQDVSYDMRNEAYAKLQSLSFSYHDRAQTGQLLARITSDVERLRMLTGRGLLRLVDSVVLLVGTTVLLLRMNVPLALLSLAVMPAIFLIMRKYRSHNTRAFAIVRTRWQCSHRASNRTSTAWTSCAALLRSTKRSSALATTTGLSMTSRRPSCGSAR